MQTEDDTRLAAARAETRDAFANRALIYAYIYDELAGELGAEQATSLLKRAIRRRGTEIGRRYRAAVEAGDLAEVARLFVSGSPCEGTLFEPSMESFDRETGSLILRMDSCPLVDAWRAAGYDETQVDLLCDIAAEVDFGTFEGAGLELTFDERQAQPGCSRCVLRLQVARPHDGVAR